MTLHVYASLDSIRREDIGWQEWNAAKPPVKAKVGLFCGGTITLNQQSQALWMSWEPDDGGGSGWNDLTTLLHRQGSLPSAPPWVGKALPKNRGSPGRILVSKEIHMPQTLNTKTPTCLTPTNTKPFLFIKHP